MGRRISEGERKSPRARAWHQLMGKIAHQDFAHEQPGELPQEVFAEAAHQASQRYHTGARAAAGVGAAGYHRSRKGIEGPQWRADISAGLRRSPRAQRWLQLLSKTERQDFAHEQAGELPQQVLAQAARQASQEYRRGGGGYRSKGELLRASPAWAAWHNEMRKIAEEDFAHEQPGELPQEVFAEAAHQASEQYHHQGGYRRRRSLGAGWRRRY